MEDFDRTNTVVPFSEEKYGGLLEQVATIDGLLEAGEDMMKIGAMDQAGVDELKTLKANAETMLRLMRRQKPRNE